MTFIAILQAVYVISIRAVQPACSMAFGSQAQHFLSHSSDSLLYTVAINVKLQGQALILPFNVLRYAR
jgi:hypothetical protein